MLKFIDSLPLPMLIMISVMLGLAPFVPEPHLVEKLRMLSNGELQKPIDIFDLVMHATPLALLAIKLGLIAARANTVEESKKD
jgi:hypothetical protein